MNFNSSDYFSYKKNKLNTKLRNEEKPLSKLNFLFQLFVVTFIIIFLIIVIAIMKYSAKIDIEYSKNNSAYSPDDEQMGYNILNEERGKIDKRLILIQQEENAPSEAKIISKEEKQIDQVMDPSHIENSKKIDKLEKIKAQNELSEISEVSQNKLELKKHIKTDDIDSAQKNIVIVSKVLVGRYLTFEEAQKIQAEIKTHIPESSPFVRKIGDIYSVQMGSYQDFTIAKSKAQELKARGYDVWIYQQ